MAAEAYHLVICSHKGGTGRTTTALALSWLWGQAGFHVLLADADPARTAGMIACDASGQCHWPGVTYQRGLPPAGVPAETYQLVVIDSPPLMDSLALGVLTRAQGVLLTCLADPLSLRTVPAAGGVLAAARVQNPRLELLGVLIGLYNPHDSVQGPMLGRLRHMHGELLLEPPILEESSVRNWALNPGSELPAGLARRGYAAVAEYIQEIIRRISGVDISLGSSRS